MLFDWLRVEVAADDVTVLAHRADAAPVVLYSSLDAAEDNRTVNDHYVSGIYRLDPFYDLHRTGAQSGVYALRDIAPDKFSTTVYFQKFYRQSGMLDEIAFVANTAANVSIHFSLSRKSRRFSSHDIRRAQPLAPVVIALMAQTWKSITAAPDSNAEHGILAQQLQQILQDQDGIALTARQSEVAALVLQGHSTASIAVLLGISAQTVKVFRKQIYQRCNISSQTELFLLMLPRLGDVMESG